MQENLRTELRECRELGVKHERERIAYSHPTMDRFVWAASRGHIRMLEQLWHKVEYTRPTHYTDHGHADAKASDSGTLRCVCGGVRWRRQNRGRAEEGEGRPTPCTSSTCWGTRWWTPATAW